MCTFQQLAAVSTVVFRNCPASVAQVEEIWQCKHIAALCVCCAGYNADNHMKLVLPSCGRVNGVPACASNQLLSQTLRQEWNFTGFVVSDCGAVTDVALHHHYVTNISAAVAATTRAGCDLNCDGNPAACCLNITVEAWLHPVIAITLKY
jgi:beta-glucosidase-like glycosyl hydrolase